MLLNHGIPEVTVYIKSHIDSCEDLGIKVKGLKFTLEDNTIAYCSPLIRADCI